MVTLMDLREKVNVCDAQSISKLYLKMTLRIREILRAIQKDEKSFSTYTLAEHPVVFATTHPIQELDSLEKLPPECAVVSAHAHDLASRLRSFKALIGTALCNTPHTAYNALANDVIYPVQQRIERDFIKRGIVMPEVFVWFRELYRDIIIEAARTQSR